jgi:hypothetical protein
LVHNNIGQAVPSTIIKIAAASIIVPKTLPIESFQDCPGRLRAKTTVPVDIPQNYQAGSRAAKHFITAFFLTGWPRPHRAPILPLTHKRPCFIVCPSQSRFLSTLLGTMSKVWAGAVLHIKIGLNK